jgi:hypothetical protein
MMAESLNSGTIDAATARQRHGKHISTATNTDNNRGRGVFCAIMYRGPTERTKPIHKRRTHPLLTEDAT